MHLIDLAGCEDNRKTGNSGQRMTESANINQSLFVLHKCIDGLAKGDTRIPYRDSKLTRLLADSLGGGAQSVMITNISPSAFNYSDTLTTLNFASKSKQIVNKPIVNEVKETKLAEDRQAQLQLWRLGQGKVAEPLRERGKEQEAQRRVDQFLAPVQTQTLSPFLREQKELSLDTRYGRSDRRRRLEQLEALLQREQAGLDDVLHGERPEALSAIARARQAKALIAKGKQLEGSDLAAAIQAYESALKHIETPHHLAKLQERIDKLKADLEEADRMDFEVISVAAPVFTGDNGKENSPNRMRVNNGRIVISKTLDVVSGLEAALLKTLNEGSESELLELNGIGKKRAESIVSWRQSGNLFVSLSDLKKIDGFSKNFAATFFKRNATDRIDFGS